MVYAAGADIGGFRFPRDAQGTEPGNFITNTGTQTGSNGHAEFTLALLYDSTNVTKGGALAAGLLIRALLPTN